MTEIRPAPAPNRPGDGAPELTICFAGLAIDFLKVRREAGGVDLFTTAVRSGAGMPVPHHHEGWDETIYGLSGVTTWQIDGRKVVVGAGQSAFIPRGTVHGFGNRSDAEARFRSNLTPGLLGPAYFREMADLVKSGRATAEAVPALMRRHGLVPHQAW